VKIQNNSKLVIDIFLIGDKLVSLYNELRQGQSYIQGQQDH